MEEEIHFGYRPEASIDNSRSKERITNTCCCARLQKWAIILIAYQYDLEFRSTKAHSNADGFSRLPLQGQANVVREKKSDGRASSIS